MPLVKIKHIASFSSEEESYKAENLLKNDTSRKWKCVAGEKQASIVFQFEKSTSISSIDIGNEGSAFIEVLVGRSSNETVQYQVILVASSFMSPQESRHGSPPNRVRMFGLDKLAPTIASQKWDLLKVVCTQPFNKRVSYGLSFIKIYTPDKDGDTGETETTTAPVENADQEGHRTSFGNFKIKPKEEKPSQYHLGSSMELYRMAKKGNRDIDVSEAAQCKTVQDAQGLIQERQKRKDSKRRPKSPEEKKIEEKRRKIDSSTSTPSKSTPVKFSNLKPQRRDSPSTPHQAAKVEKTKTKPNTPKAKPKDRDPSQSTKPPPRHTRDRPYNKILDGVIFILSGFQNPLRGQLRDMGLAMGAQYRRDWTPDSTHLICAFPNTPKYCQVIGCGGKIVKKDWFNECSSRKRLLSWRKYSMNPNQSDGSSSSEEDDEIQEDVKPQLSRLTPVKHVAESSVRRKSPKKEVVEEKKEENPYDASTDEEAGKDDPYGGSTDEDAGDTEDEIERIQGKRNGDKEEEDDDDIYNASTDEDSDHKQEDGLPPLPDYLNDKQFFFYGEFYDNSKKQIKRNIVACGGKVLEYMSEDVDYIVTEQSWDSHFDAALTDNASLIFVKPSWIFHCSSQRKLIPYQPYVVPPL